MPRGTTWFKAKRAKLQKQNRAGVPSLKHGVLERDKPINQRHETIAAAERQRALIAPLLDDYAARKGELTTYVPSANPAPVGKGKRKFDRSTGGNYTWAIKPCVVYATDSVLIPRR
jgi:hypothetical protein